MGGRETGHEEEEEVLVIPGVDVYLQALQGEFDAGCLDLSVYESVRVRTSAYKLEGEQLTFPVDKDHGSCESTPSAPAKRSR